MNILIVEDEKDEHVILGKILKDNNLTFSDSEKTMYEKLTQNCFDLIIMDVGLKDSKSGIELIKELKSNDAYSRIPILCLTSYVYHSEEDKVMDAGANAFLAKPVIKKQLLAQVEAFRPD